MTNIRITNAGGTINCESLTWQESQLSEVAIRKVPTRSDGDIVDTDTYVLKPKRISTTIRLSDAEKATLQLIFDANASVTIAAVNDAGTWTYTAWFEDKPLFYQYADQKDATREWKANLKFVSATYSFA